MIDEASNQHAAVDNANRPAIAKAVRANRGDQIRDEFRNESHYIRRRSPSPTSPVHGALAKRVEPAEADTATHPAGALRERWRAALNERVAVAVLARSEQRWEASAETVLSGLLHAAGRAKPRPLTTKEGGLRSAA